MSVPMRTCREHTRRYDAHQMRCYSSRVIMQQRSRYPCQAANFQSVRGVHREGGDYLLRDVPCRSTKKRRYEAYKCCIAQISGCQARRVRLRGTLEYTKRTRASSAWLRSSSRAAATALRAAESLEISVGGRKVQLETGEIGRQANGAVLAKDGETVLYTTACCEKEASEQASFSPFSVTYSERFSAIGRTSGSFFRREGRPQINEMIISRLIDRPLRPMLPKGWTNDTQVLSWLMSYDGQHQPEALAITAAGAALAVSDIPLQRAVAGVHVALVHGDFIVNPTSEQKTVSPLDLTIAGTADAILMIEGFCEFLTEEQMLEALTVGSEAIAHICREVQAWADEVGKPKRAHAASTDASLHDVLAATDCASQIKNAYKKGAGSLIPLAIQHFKNTVLVY